MKTISEEIIVEVLNELTKIRQLLLILVEDALKKKLEKVATTKERKKMWSLLDGTLSTEEIAKRVNVTVRAVQIFVKELKEMDLVIIENGGSGGAVAGPLVADFIEKVVMYETQ